LSRVPFNAKILLYYSSWLMESAPQISPKASFPSKNSSLKFLLVIFCLYFVLRAAAYIIFPHALTQASDLTVNNILSAINRERQLRNLLTLNTDSRLSSAAQSKADDMLARHYFSHTDPEGNYIWPKIEAAGYTPYLQLGENLAIEFYDTESLVQAWMNSPTHRANILNDGFRDQGMGLDFGDTTQGQYHSVIVNTFGTLISRSKEQVASKTQIASPPPPADTQPAKPEPQPESESVTELAPPSTTAPVAAEPPPFNINLAIRGDEPTKPSFTVATKKQHETASPSPSELAPQAVTGQKPKFPFDQEQAGRYLTLGLGAVLLVLLLSDLKVALSQKIQKLDKKLNNIVLLLLALAAVAMIYWL